MEHRRRTGLRHVRVEGGAEGGGDADEDERAEARSGSGWHLPSNEHVDTAVCSCCNPLCRPRATAPGEVVGQHTQLEKTHTLHLHLFIPPRDAIGLRLASGHTGSSPHASNSSSPPPPPPPPCAGRSARDGGGASGPLTLCSSRCIAATPETSIEIHRDPSCAPATAPCSSSSSSVWSLCVRRGDAWDLMGPGRD